MTFVLPGVLKAASVGDFGAVAPEATVDAGIQGDGIGGFNFDGEANIEGVSTAVLSEDINGTESRHFGEGGSEFMLLIGITHEVVFVADGEAGDEAIG